MGPPAAAGERGGTRGRLAASLGVGLPFLALYASRIDRWPGVADTAKFQLIGATLGTPHAPGYSTYVLLLHLAARLLPGLSWAASADLVSVLCTAATVALVVWLAQALGARTLPAVAAGVAFGSLAAIRAIAAEAEVYPLHLLLAAGTLAALQHWRQTGRWPALLCAGVLLALAFSHHPTIVCILPAVAVLAAGRRLPVRRLLAWAPLFVLLAGAPFGYVVWRSYAPPTSHLEMQAHSAAQLWEGIGGAQHRANLFREGPTALLTRRLPWLLGQLWHQEGWLLGLAAVALLSWPNRRDRTVLALLAAGSAAFTFVYSVPDLELYLLPAHLALALAVALGAQALADRLPARLAPVLFALVAISPAALAAAGWGPRLPPADDAARVRSLVAAVDAVPPGAVLVSFDYPTGMALTYEAWERHGGRPRVLAMPELALVVPTAVDRLRRHLAGGTPLRLGPRDELLAPGTPLLCHCLDGATRDALAREGILTTPTGEPALFLLSAAPAPPVQPAAVLVSRLLFRRSLLDEIAAMQQPGFTSAQAAVRLGAQAGEEQRPPGGVASLRHVGPDEVVADVVSPAGGWLVLTDLYQSRWTVSVDGRASSSFRADVLFLALPVPGGLHRVEVRRDRRPFSLARWLRSPWGYLLL